jgi:hypothetical protein
MASMNEISPYMKAGGCEPGIRCCAGQVIQNISYAALFIIGCVAAAGAMPMTTAGWLAVGFGSAALISNLAAGGLKDRKCMAIIGTLTAASIILVGALGVAGLGALTTTKAIGIAVLVLTMTNMTYCAWSCDIGRKVMQSQASRED